MSLDRMAAARGCSQILAGLVLGVFGLIVHAKADTNPMFDVAAWLLWAAACAFVAAGAILVAFIGAETSAKQPTS